MRALPAKHIMALKETIQGDVKIALKQGNGEVAGVLRMALAAVMAKEKEKRYAIAKEHPEKTDEALAKESLLSDEEIISVLASEVKKRRDAIALYEQGNRPELAKKENSEIVLLQKYLPAQLSADDIKKMVEESIAATGAKGIKEMGKVMADLNPKIKGRAEGGQVSAMVKKLLS